MVKKINVWNIFQQSFIITLKNWKIVYPLALPIVFSLIVSLFSIVFLLMSISEAGVTSLLTYWWVTLILLTVIVFSIWLSMTSVGTIILAVEKIHKKQKINQTKLIWKQAYKSSWRLVVAFSLEQLFLTVGLLFLIIPGIFLAIKLSLLVPACILEKKGFGIRRSWNATKGNFWQIFLILVIWNAVFLVLGYIPYMWIINLLLLPAYLTTLTLLYIQLRKG